jgi:hypothetical protein
LQSFAIVFENKINDKGTREAPMTDLLQCGKKYLR